MILNQKQTNHALIRAGVYTLVVIGAWTIWCFLMMIWPEIFAQSTLRAIARVTFILLPALIFYQTGPRETSFFDYFLLREHWKRGVLIGGGLAILYFSISRLANTDAQQNALHLPIGFSIWFNFIIGSPLAEEMFFRGVLLQELQSVLGKTKATIVSALAFTLLHLPQWLLLDHLFGMELLSLSLTIFVYGILFAILVNATKSLWGALLPHWINNLILLALS